MGADKSGGDESGNWLKLGTSVAGAVGGAMLGGPAGAAMGWNVGGMAGDVGNKVLGTGNNPESLANLGQTVGNLGSTALSFGSNIPANKDLISSTGNSLTGETMMGVRNNNITPANYASSAGLTGKNPINAAITGSNNVTVPTESGFSKMSDLLNKTGDTFGAIQKNTSAVKGILGDLGMGSTQTNVDSQLGLQPMQAPVSPMMSSPTMLNQVLAAQLMNPAQNRLANMRGRI